MIAALKVELVGEDDALAIFLSVLGPLLIATAAVVAALVARKTANERQEEQLAHDSERQREQLEHDTARQERQLQHDREMRQKEHARGALDSAIELVQEAHAAALDLEYEAEKCETEREESGADVDPSKLGECWKDLSDKTSELYGAGVRLMVRLGAKHEIPVNLGKLNDSWGELEDSLVLVFRRNRSEKELKDFKKTQDEVRAAYSALMVACEQWLQFSTDSVGNEGASEK